MKKRIISLCLAVIIVICCVFIPKLLSHSKPINYGKKSGNIVFGKAKKDITEEVIASDDTVVASNNGFILSLDSSANPIITHKTSGRVWKAIPDSDGGNSKYSSALFFDYYADNSSKSTFYSSDDCVDKGQFRVFSEKSGVKVEYIFGKMSVEYVYPQIISQKRMNNFLNKMSNDDCEFIKRRYELYDIKDYDGETRTYLLKEYPRLKNEILYIIGEMPTKGVSEKTNNIFIDAGYTSADKKRDESGAESEETNEPVFKIDVHYTLTENGFSASIDTNSIEFYSEYPISEIHLLPYFDCYRQSDSGYIVLPYGSGGLIDMGEDFNEKEKNLSFSVYGEDLTLNGNLPSNAAQCTFPMYGCYKNESGYMCVVSKGAEQANINVYKGDIYNYAYSSFDLIDNQEVNMKAKNTVCLFAPEIALKKYKLDYYLFAEQTYDNAYSYIAGEYRDLLLKDGLLNKNGICDTPFLAEIINTVQYSDMMLGCIPVKREKALTDFNDVKSIENSLLKTVKNDSLSILLTGWNKNGLNKQGYLKDSVSPVAGGKKDLEELEGYNKEKNISLFLDVSFSMIEPFSGDNYSPASSSARGINNNITSLSKLDYHTYDFSKTNIQLVSSDRYSKIVEKYLNSKVLNSFNLGVSELSSYLYSDYSETKAITKSQAVLEIEKSLSKIKKSNKKIIGNQGNLYSIKYLSLIDNMPTPSATDNIFKCEIPFVEMIIHGYVPYVSSELNSSSNLRQDLLKLIENGSGLHYKITSTEFEGLADTDFNYLYNTLYTTNQKAISESYKFVNKALAGLGKYEMTGHKIVSDDVVKTEYENGTSIYINYGKSTYTSGDVTVNPKNYLRVDEDKSE